MTQSEKEMLVCRLMQDSKDDHTIIAQALYDSFTKEAWATLAVVFIRIMVADNGEEDNFENFRAALERVCKREYEKKSTLSELLPHPSKLPKL
jgi:hypothetical protein